MHLLFVNEQKSTQGDPTFSLRSVIGAVALLIKTSWRVPTSINLRDMQ